MTTPEQIDELAKRIYRGEVFTSDQLKNPGLLGMVFLPLAFMGEEAKAKMAEEKPAMFWAPMSAAFPRSINGYPMFGEVHLVNEEDRQKVWARVKEIEELLGDKPKPEMP